MIQQSIFGMNLRELTGEKDSSLPSIRWYFVLAIVLMITTFSGWLLWSKGISRVKEEKLQALLRWLHL